MEITEEKLFYIQNRSRSRLFACVFWIWRYILHLLVGFLSVSLLFLYSWQWHLSLQALNLLSQTKPWFSPGRCRTTKHVFDISNLTTDEVYSAMQSVNADKDQTKNQTGKMFASLRNSSADTEQRFLSRGSVEKLSLSSKWHETR